MADEYLPLLSDLIQVDQLPESLISLTGDLSSLLSSIKYNNYVAERAPNEPVSYYEIDIIFTADLLKFTIPGTGIQITVNPDLNSTNNNVVLPFTINWRWDILRYFSDFQLASQSFSPKEFYSIISAIISGSDEQLLYALLNYFIDIDDPSDESNSDYTNEVDIDPTDNEEIEGTPDVSEDQDLDFQAEDAPLIGTELLEQFVIDAKQKFPELMINQPLDSDAQKAYDATIAGIENSGLNVFNVLVDLYVADQPLQKAYLDIKQIYSNFLNTDPIKLIEKLIIPEVAAVLNVTLGVEFPRNILLPVDINNLVIPGEIKTKMILDVGQLFFNSSGEFGFREDVEITFDPNTPKAQLASTGLIISFSRAILDLSTSTNIPEADKAGYTSDFIGLYAKEAEITLAIFGQPGTMASASIFANNLLIGTGGVSGMVSLEDNGVLHRKLGSFAVALDHFSLNFRQGSIISSDISGKLTLDKFVVNGQPLTIDIEAMIHDDGDFSITVKAANVLPKITLPNVFEVEVRSLEIGHLNNDYYISLAGTLSFIADVPVFGQVLPKNIDITKLRIWDNGHIEFEGGGLQVPRSFKLKIGPVKIEVTHMSLGSFTKKLNAQDTGREYRYFGFDGMVNTGRAGLKATGNGIKYYFSVDDGPFDQFIGIDGIAIDITVPANAAEKDAAFSLHGMLNVQQPKLGSSIGATQYTGTVSAKIPKLGISGSAGMQLDPSIPSFVVDLGLDLSTPLPLGATSLGIYGFRGLLGQHYVPSKQAAGLDDNNTWWDYYKAPVKGVNISKFEDEAGFSIGAGTTIATIYDSGYTFSCKLFVLLGLPNVFLIQGQAGILQTRLSLMDDVDPPFSALIAIGDQSFMGNLAVDFALPKNDTINVFTLQGTLELAFFFNNASGWYINIGKDQPDSARIQAKILNLFQGYAYLMMSAQGFKAGAGAQFKFKKSIGPVGIDLGAWIDLGAHLSFKPAQIGGYINLGGYANFNVWKIKLGLAVAVGLAVEAPHPFNIIGSLEISVKILFKRIKLKVELRLVKQDDNIEYLMGLIPILDLPQSGQGYLPAVATNIRTGEKFQVNYLNIADPQQIPSPGDSAWQYKYDSSSDLKEFTIPLDSFIDIELLKPVKPNDFLGGSGNQMADGYIEMLPPKKGVHDQVQHRYELTGLKILAWKGDFETGQWVDYNIYEAVTTIVASNVGSDHIDLHSLKPGYWQFSEKDKFNKIRLLSQDVFSFLGQAISTLPDLDAKGFGQKDLFCFEEIISTAHVDWKQEAEGTVYLQGQLVAHDNLTFTFTGGNGNVAKLEGSLENLLCFSDISGSLEVQLPESVTYLALNFGSNTHRLSVNFIVTSYKPDVFNKVVKDLNTTQTNTVNPSVVNSSVIYNNPAQPIDTVRIELDGRRPGDYTGDLVIGGHLPLPDVYTNTWLNSANRDIELDRALMDVKVYRQDMPMQSILGPGLPVQSNIVAIWSMENIVDTSGTHKGYLTGSPEMETDYFQTNSDGLEQHLVYRFSADDDALVIPYFPSLLVENGNFCIESTIIFEPYSTGVGTLLYKMSSDSPTQLKKGFAIHLSQQAQTRGHVFEATEELPLYSLWLTFYDGDQSWGQEVMGDYTYDCSTMQLALKQFKHLLLSFNRQTGKVDIYLDRIFKASFDIPEAFGVFTEGSSATYLQDIEYLTAKLQARKDDNSVSEAVVISETQDLNNLLNHTVQPIWRPDTIFAVEIKTRDTAVHGDRTEFHNQTHVFGFKTAGPLGHFHQESKAYAILENEDRAAEFKLSNLRSYIDYERSYPDAMGRYNLSKPVFWLSPQINMFYNEAYMKAMFSDWDNYQGLEPVSCSLEIQLIDTFGNNVLQNVLHESEDVILIDNENYKVLPVNQQILFLMNQAAAAGSCNPLPAPFIKKIRHFHYEFPSIRPSTLYTALFTSVYATGTFPEQRAEVHKFSFISSRYATFEDQVNSVIVDPLSNPVIFSVEVIDTALSQADLITRVGPLLNSSDLDDPADSLQYTGQFDRIVYGGLKLNRMEPSDRTELYLIRNIDPDNNTSKKLIGIVMMNPEPFNDPKLPAELRSDIVVPNLTAPEGTTNPQLSLSCIHSSDTSAVLIVSSDFDIPIGSLQINLKQKAFNGIQYTVVASVDLPEVALMPYFNS